MTKIIKIGDVYKGVSNYDGFAKIEAIYAPSDYNYRQIKKESGWEGNSIVVKFAMASSPAFWSGRILHYRKSDFTRKYKPYLVKDL